MTKAELEAKLVDVMETCERLSAERDTACAAIDRVRALCDDKNAPHYTLSNGLEVISVDRIAAALDPEEDSDG